MIKRERNISLMEAKKQTPFGVLFSALISVLSASIINGVLIGVLLGVLSASISRADQSSSTNFIIERGVIDVGGTTATSSGFNLRTSIGQIGTGISSSTNFLIRGGFLNFFVPAPPAPPPAPSPAPGGAPPPGPGGGGGGTGYPFRPSATGVAAIFLPSVVCNPDFNSDNSIDIIDLSIILFHYNSKGANLGCYDLNRNSKVDFPDISILMYYWTG